METGAIHSSTIRTSYYQCQAINICIRSRRRATDSLSVIETRAGSRSSMHVIRLCIGNAKLHLHLRTAVTTLRAEDCVNVGTSVTRTGKHSVYRHLFHRLTRTAYLYNGCLPWYNVVLASQVHSSVKYSQQSQLRTRATVE